MIINLLIDYFYNGGDYVYADLVCKGGGILGLALVGSIAYFEEQGYVWKRLAGTSVGAVVASLCAVGYKSQELHEIIEELDYKSIADKNILQSIPFVGPVSSLFISKGIHSGDYIENFLREKYQKKGKTTFKDISYNNKSRLKIIATDVTNQKLLTLPDDLYKYNIDPMSFDIAKAVRMSLSIPIFYNPKVLFDNNNQPCYIVDGGLLSNLPVWIFDCDKIPRWPTFGLNLINTKPVNQKKTSSLRSYLYDIIFTSLKTSEDVYFKECDAIRIVNIPTSISSTVYFDISEAEKQQLYNSGYYAAKQFLSNWDFSLYKRLYRS